MTLEIERLRRETPGCREVIHFNNAGASLMPEPVVNAIISHLRREAEIGGYEAAAESFETIEGVYDSIASLIGCTRDEIAVVENATRAWDMAFYSIPFRSGDTILTSECEYASNFIAYLQVCKRTGATVRVIPADEYGAISVEALKDAMDESVKLISLTHVPTNGGLVNPAAEVGRVARDAGVLFLLDACQSMGQIPIDVREIDCHMLSATGRKYLRGPRGTGFLYVRKDILPRLEPPFLDLHAATWSGPDRFAVRADARRFENWETNYATKIGLGVAIEYATALGLERIWERIGRLADDLRSRLALLPGVTVRDLGVIRCGIVSFSVEGKKPEDIKKRLDQARINVSVSPMRYTLLDMERRGLSAGVVRASVHYYNTEEEIGRFTYELERIICL
ncbi:MAG: aminotransferase class V-fold PLP-dependent enzyme [Desulfomonile tiedjei]|uniref:Aminotransferase class V-fold PLP-dependent enzyme n=1 Tax=Desulfomonile tiedjei TaxID=2358 RepID=A0A9D6V058_9BACT|nr:aminotransferase class V-fold PLP-dependent enzyme [Desulfomonile tiedjei]